MTFKTAIVTGGGRGIGAAISKLLVAYLLLGYLQLAETARSICYIMG